MHAVHLRHVQHKLTWLVVYSCINYALVVLLYCYLRVFCSVLFNTKYTVLHHVVSSSPFFVHVTKVTLSESERKEKRHVVSGEGRAARVIKKR